MKNRTLSAMALAILAVGALELLQFRLLPQLPQRFTVEARAAK